MLAQQLHRAASILRDWHHDQCACARRILITAYGLNAAKSIRVYKYHLSLPDTSILPKHFLIWPSSVKVTFALPPNGAVQLLVFMIPGFDMFT